MFYYDENQFIKEYDGAARTGNISNYEYAGRLLVPGADASIIVKTSSMTAAIGDVSAPIDHPIHAFLANHEDEIRDVTAQSLRLYQEIVIAGRWHYDGDETESFEPYLMRGITNDGSAKTTKYDYEFCGRGEYGFTIELDSGVDGQSAFAMMVAATAHSTYYSHIRPGLAESLGLPTGMLWFPVVPSELPFLVVEHAMQIMEERSSVASAGHAFVPQFPGRESQSSAPNAQNFLTTQLNSEGIFNAKYFRN